MRASEPETPEQASRRAAEAFGQRWRRAPDLVGMAPGRVNLIGEHVDYAGGVCLPIALRHATYAGVRRRDDDRVRMSSGAESDAWEGRLDDIAPGQVEGWVGYAGGVLWALREEGYDVPALDVHVESTVPLGAGLSSSAALECSVAAAVMGLLDVDLDDDTRRRLVDACMRAESEVAKAPTGGLDQNAAMLAREAQALLVDFGRRATRLVPFDPSSRGLGLLVIDTRVRHAHTTGGYGSRREEAEQAGRQLGVASLGELTDVTDLSRVDEPLRPRVRHHVTENARTRAFAEALEAGDWNALGPLMDASHASLRDDYQVSCEELDVACETARGAGALGARMTGGGFGGSAITLAPLDRLDSVVEAVTSAFGDRGWREPSYLVAEAGPGAAVLHP